MIEIQLARLDPNDADVAETRLVLSRTSCGLNGLHRVGPIETHHSVQSHVVSLRRAVSSKTATFPKLFRRECGTNRRRKLASTIWSTPNPDPRGVQSEL